MARYHLKLPAAEFRSLTLRQFTKLMELHKDEKQRETERFGVVAAAIANFSWSEKKRPFRPSDFFNLPDPEPERMSNQHMLNIFMAIYKAQQNKATQSN